jgi:hypothetical protein
MRLIAVGANQARLSRSDRQALIAKRRRFMASLARGTGPEWAVPGQEVGPAALVKPLTSVDSAQVRSTLERAGAQMNRARIVFAALIAMIALTGLVTSGASAKSEAWLTTRTVAAHKLPARFKDVSSVACAPDKTSATQVFGTTRYWQRFWCSGRTYDRLGFRLLYKATGQCSDCWTITNLSGLSASHLRVRHAAVKATATSTGGSASCGSGYYRNVDGHCVPRPSSDPSLEPGGPTAICADGSYSYSEHASGTCSHHGGVARWINHP